MVKVSMEVRKGASRFAVAVSAENLQRAVSIVQGRYPSSDCRVLFPAGTEDFVGAYSARIRMGERLAGTAA